MPTDNRANHRHRHRLPDNDPGYPPMDYYQAREREAQEIKRAREFWLRYWNQEEEAKEYETNANK